jgi:hypothetical protein
MSRNNTFALVIMIWITVLTFWTVNNITTSLKNHRSVTVSGLPVQPIPQQPQQISTIQIDKDTVWIFEANSNDIKVVTHDENGYNITETEMNFSIIK